MTTLDEWLKTTLADAERRKLPSGLRPLLEGLARSTAQLRAGDWNERVQDRGKGGTTSDGPTSQRHHRDPGATPGRG